MPASSDKAIPKATCFIVVLPELGFRHVRYAASMRLQTHPFKVSRTVTAAIAIH
jgi:hypothetical protein